MARADVGDEEIGLMRENYEEKRKCQGSWKLAILALIVGTLAVAGLVCFTFHNPTQTLAEKEPAFIEEAPQGFDVSGQNSNSGNQAGRDIHNGDNYYYPPPQAPQESECHVKSETKARIQFRDPGTFISYTLPDSHDGLGGRFWGKFYRNWEEVTDVKDLPRCLTKLWLFDDGLGGDLAQLPRALKNLSLAASKKITGNVAALPQTLQHLGLQLTWNITGDLNALPKGLVHLNLLSAIKVTGDIWELPRNLQFVNLQNNCKIIGEIQHLPKGLTKAFLYGAHLDGSIKDLPRNLSVAYFGNACLSGEIKDLSPHLVWASFKDCYSGDIKGKVSDAPGAMQCKKVRKYVFCQDPDFSKLVGVWQNN